MANKDAMPQDTGGHAIERAPLLQRWRESGKLSGRDEQRLREFEAVDDLKAFEEAEGESGPVRPIEEVLEELALEGRISSRVLPRFKKTA
jgi:hypothetical protein